MTLLVRSRADLSRARAELGTQRVGAVLTMGALHEGHIALLRAARAADDAVVTTVFVNPTQFAPGEDLNRYPRSLDADLARCSREGVDVVWAPDVSDVYLRQPRTAIDPGPLGDQLEGAARPGHFAGVLLVVAKLLRLIDPAAAYFGAKDWQQLTLVRAMALDLDLPVRIEAVETVREPDGLALSSRNVFLTDAQRVQAVALSEALFAGRAAQASGADAVLAAARWVLDRFPGIAPDYLQLRTPDLAAPARVGTARLLVAARIGSTRLIDNVEIQLG